MDSRNEEREYMRDEPLVSILIPTFRRPKELRKALESVVVQTYGNLEILVSNNDCENEETNAVCHEFAEKDERISFHVQPANIGGAENLHFLFRSAKGEYTLSLNDDDWVSDNFIKLTLRNLLNDPMCVMVQGSYLLHTPSCPSGSPFIMDDNVHDGCKERMLTTVLATVSGGMPPHHGLCRTRHLENSIYSHEKLRFGEDWIAGIKIASFGNIRNIPEATYHKRWCQNNAAYYADFFNAPGVNENNFSEQLFLQMADSIAYDSFYDDKLERLERMSLVTQLGVIRESRKKSTEIEHVKGIGPCLRYLWRQPFALFKKKATAMLEIKRRRQRK